MGLLTTEEFEQWLEAEKAENAARMAAVDKESRRAQRQMVFRIIEVFVGVAIACFVTIASFIVH